MEHETQHQENPNKSALISSFIEFTSSSEDEARFFLESHQWDLDSAVSNFLAKNSAAPILPPPVAPPPTRHLDNSPSDHSPSQSPPRSRSRSRSPSRSPSPALPSRRNADNKPSGSNTKDSRDARTLGDLNRIPPGGSYIDPVEAQDSFTDGGKSVNVMVVRDPPKYTDVESIFAQARRSGTAVVSSSFTGSARLLSGETLAPAQPEVVTHRITFWRNGFTADDGPLRNLDDPANASFLESVKGSTCPEELVPADPRTKVKVYLLKRNNENYSEPKSAFQGVGRTVGSSSSSSPTPSEPTPASGSVTTTEPRPSMGLVVDSSLPTTSIRLRLADGTRMVSSFN